MQIEFNVVGSITQHLQMTDDFKNIEYDELLEKLNSYEFCTTLGHGGDELPQVIEAATGVVVAYVIDQVSAGEYDEFE